MKVPAPPDAPGPGVWHWLGLWALPPITLGLGIALCLGYEVGALFILSLGGIALAFFVRRKQAQERHRAEAMAAAAQLMGFSFTAVVNNLQLASYVTLPLFQRGHSHAARNLLTGAINDQEVLIFDYEFREGTDSGVTYSQTVALLPNHQATLPVFRLVPETSDHKIAQWFGYQDIDFEDYPEFSQIYLLRGPDEAAIRQAFGRPVLELFERNRIWSIESQDGHLLVYRDRKLRDPNRCPELAAKAVEFLQVLKSSTS